MRLLLFILIISLASCGTTRKNIQTTKVVTDSTVIKDQALMIAELNKELQNKRTDSFTQIITDVRFEKCDSVPATVVFDNGKLASVTGRLQSISQSHTASLLREEQLQRSNDSLVMLLESERSTKKVEIVEKVKEVKRTVTPIWVWFLIALLVLWLLRIYLPRIIDFFKLNL